MKRFSITLLLITILSGIAHAQTPVDVWKRYLPFNVAPTSQNGGGGRTFMKVKATTDGGFILGISSPSTDSLFSRSGGASGLSDVFIMKFDKDAKLIWNKRFGGSSIEYLYDLAVASDGSIFILVISGSNDGDFDTQKGKGDTWWVKLNSSGGLLWKKNFGGSEVDEGMSMSITNDNGLIISGQTLSTDGDLSGIGVIGGTIADVFVVKTNSSGDVVWKKRFGGSDRDESNQIIQTSDNNFIMAGYTYSNDGDFSGVTKGQSDAWVLKLDATGTKVWNKTYGGSSDDRFYNIIEKNGKYLVLGATGSNSNDFQSPYPQSGLLSIINADGTLGTSYYYDAFMSIFEIKRTEYSVAQNGDIIWTSVSNTGDTKRFNMFTRINGSNYTARYKKKYNGTVATGSGFSRSITTLNDGSIVFVGSGGDSTLDYLNIPGFKSGMLGAVFMTRVTDGIAGINTQENDVKSIIKVQDFAIKIELTEENRLLTAELFSIDGKSVRKVEFSENAPYVFDINGITKGVYVLRLISEKGIVSKIISIN